MKTGRQPEKKELFTFLPVSIKPKLVSIGIGPPVSGRRPSLDLIYAKTDLLKIKNFINRIELLNIAPLLYFSPLAEEYNCAVIFNILNPGVPLIEMMNAKKLYEAELERAPDITNFCLQLSATPQFPVGNVEIFLEAFKKIKLIDIYLSYLTWFGYSWRPFHVITIDHIEKGAPLLAE